LKRTQIDRMAGKLVVEGEAIAGKSDIAETALVFHPSCVVSGRRFPQRKCGQGDRFVDIGRMKRVGPQCVLDIGGPATLVLLLVMEAKHDSPRRLFRRTGGQ